jgi:hypothetical protein
MNVCHLAYQVAGSTECPGALAEPADNAQSHLLFTTLSCTLDFKLSRLEAERRTATVERANREFDTKRSNAVESSVSTEWQLGLRATLQEIAAGPSVAETVA